MSFFTPNKEELNAAKTGGKTEPIPFKDGEEATFLIEEVKEKDDLLIIQTKVVGGEHNGKEHSFFYNKTREYSLKDFFRVLTLFYTDEQIANKEASPAGLVSKMMKSKAKIKPAKNDPSVMYTNFNYFQKVDSAPQLNVVGGTGAANIPF